MEIATLLPLLTAILEAMPQAIDSVHQIWSLATGATAPTAAEQADYDMALAAAHRALQQS